MLAGVPLNAPCQILRGRSVKVHAARSGVPEKRGYLNRKTCRRKYGRSKVPRTWAAIRVLEGECRTTEQTYEKQFFWAGCSRAGTYLNRTFAILAESAKSSSFHNLCKKWRLLQFPEEFTWKKNFLKIKCWLPSLTAHCGGRGEALAGWAVWRGAVKIAASPSSHCKMPMKMALHIVSGLQKMLCLIPI